MQMCYCVAGEGQKESGQGLFQSIKVKEKRTGFVTCEIPADFVLGD